MSDPAPVKSFTQQGDLCLGKDKYMTLGSKTRALMWAVSLAAAGAVIAYLLAGGPWAIVGIAIGAVTGSFAPNVYDEIRGRDSKREDLRNTFEKTPPRSWARTWIARRMRHRAAGLQGQSVQGLRGGRPGRLNGGSLAASARRRPSAIHCGINASSAPAIWHSSATAWPLASYSGPLFSAEPSASPATSASRSPRSPATSRSSAAAEAFSASVRPPHRARRRAMLDSRALRSRPLSARA
jgi:hypothetical protein